MAQSKSTADAECENGVSFGSALAIAISYTANHSILWAIIDGVLGWLYVIYYALFRSWRALRAYQTFGERSAINVIGRVIDDSIPTLKA